MSFAFPADWFNSQRNIQRAAAITLLVLIHLFALSLLMTSKQATAPFPRAVREIIISFPIFHPRVISQKREAMKTHTRMRGGPLPSFALPPNAIAPAAQSPPAGIGHALFGCDPAAQMNLDEQSGCGALAAKPGPEEVGMPKKSRVIQTARWENELAIKHSRVLVPCLSFYQGRQAVGSSNVNQGAMVDLICVGKGLLNGFGEPK